MSSTSSHGSMSTGSRCSLSASSRGSLSSLNHSASNDGLITNSNDYFPSSYHPVLNPCPPIYETTTNLNHFESNAPNSYMNNTLAKGSTSSRDSTSSPPISPLHGERDRGCFTPAYQGSRAEYYQYSDTNGSERLQPCYQVIFNLCYYLHVFKAKPKKVVNLTADKNIPEGRLSSQNIR